MLGLSDEGHTVVVSRIEGHGLKVSRVKLSRLITIVWKSLISLVEGAVGGSIGPVLVVAALMSAVWDVGGTEISFLAERSALSLGEQGKSINILLLNNIVVVVAVSSRVPGSPGSGGGGGNEGYNSKFHFIWF